MNTLRIDLDDMGIALISIDVPGRSMNVLTPELVGELDQTIGTIASTANIKGVIFTSGKTTSFLAGADLTDLVNAHDSQITPSQGMKISQHISSLYRRLETCGKPVAVAINGLAFGGGLEFCLACHYRVIDTGPNTLVGLPEVKVGLLSGAGGTQRLPRLVGIPTALPWLLKGNTITPAEALSAGLVDALLPKSDLIADARRWLLTRPLAVQPWDRKGFSVPNGAGPLATHAMQSFVSGTALVTGASATNYPAPLAILSSVFEGTQVAIDVGLRIESKYFGKLLAGPVARNLMRTLFVSKGNADKLASRPASIPKVKVSKVGFIGASSADADVVLTNVRAGIQVMLLDSASESAAEVKASIAKRLTRKVADGSIPQSIADSCLNLITPIERCSDLTSWELAIESNADIDAHVFRQVEDLIPPNCLLVTTRLTPPIGALAQYLTRPANFIGVHFAHPLTKSPLVEIIKGPQTSDESLARTLDYMAQLRKTPIIVGDFPGFFVSRIMDTYLREGQKMLEDGVAAALVENAAKAAGFSLGPLALSDDVTMTLQRNILEQQDREEVAERFKISTGRTVIDRMLELQRPGGEAGGFYDYAANGQRRLWSDLAKAFPTTALQPDSTDLRSRFLTIMALESARCLEDGVIHHPADGDLGSVLGAGYPSWTGGTLSYIDTIGVSQFIRDCRRLEDRWGPRYKPTESLIERGKLDRGFYPVKREPVRANAG